MPVISKILCILLLGAVLLISACGDGGKGGSTNAGQITDPGQLARQYMADNKFDEAEAAFIKAIQVAPNNILNYGSLARLYLLQNKYGDAEKAVRAGLQIDANNQDMGLLLATVLVQKGDSAGAVNELNGILSKNPKNGKAWYKLAGLPGGGDWAKDCLLKALSCIPANIVLRLKLAELCAGAGKADSARSFLEGVRKIAPDFSAVADAGYQKAISLLQGNHSGDALPFIVQFHKVMKTTAAYASGLDEIDVPELQNGYPAFTTTLTNQGLVSLSEFVFTDATSEAGLAGNNASVAGNPVIAVADYDQQEIFMCIAVLWQLARRIRSVRCLPPKWVILNCLRA